VEAGEACDPENCKPEGGETGDGLGTGVGVGAGVGEGEYPAVGLAKLPPPMGRVPPPPPELVAVGVVTVKDTVLVFEVKVTKPVSSVD